MNKSFLCHLSAIAIFCFATQYSLAQNIGINTTQPKANLQVDGNFLVTTPYRGSTAEPAANKQVTMLNNSTIHFENDSIVRFYDPGGPAGNYLPNMTANVRCSTYVASANDRYAEIVIESLQLGTGDSLLITEDFGNTFYRVGNTNFVGPVTINSSSLQLTFTFKSNGDASVGAGFSILVRTMYSRQTGEPKIIKSGFGMAYHSYEQAIRLGSLDQTTRGNKSVVIGNSSQATASSAIAMGSYARANASSSIALGAQASTNGFSAVALGSYATANGNESVALGTGTAGGFRSIALGGASASGDNSMGFGVSADAEGEHAVGLGYFVKARAFSSIAVGRYNVSYAGENPLSWVANDPLFVIGNGSGFSSRSNALTVQKNGRMGLGTDFPLTDLHILQGSGGGLMLENPADGNKWRLYSASGDNNLTFYNNSNVEIADIDDVTGTYSALSDLRFKKNILPMSAVLPSVMQLNPAYYQFNWQQDTDEKQIGLLAQQAYQLFPQLVSYDKKKDVYKMNYAGFSTVALKAIQEQQQQIEELKKELAAIKELLQTKNN